MESSKTSSSLRSLNKIGRDQFKLTHVQTATQEKGKKHDKARQCDLTEILDSLLPNPKIPKRVKCSMKDSKVYLNE